VCDVSPAGDDSNEPGETAESNALLARSQFFRFLIVGGFAATINFGSRIVLSRWLAFAVAIVLAYLLGLVTAFVLNRRFVFPGATNRLHHQMFWFVAVNVLALAQTLLVSLLFAHYVLPGLGITWHAPEIAHAFGIITPIFTSYIGHKRFSFSAG
jgi:putative flippase GtrA